MWLKSVAALKEADPRNGCVHGPAPVELESIHITKWHVGVPLNTMNGVTIRELQGSKREILHRIVSLLFIVVAVNSLYLNVFNIVFFGAVNDNGISCVLTAMKIVVDLRSSSFFFLFFFVSW